MNKSGELVDIYPGLGTGVTTSGVDYQLLRVPVVVGARWKNIGPVPYRVCDITLGSSTTTVTTVELVLGIHNTS